jgi:hypothetical protein
MDIVSSALSSLILNNISHPEQDGSSGNAFITPLSLFWKNKIRFMRLPCSVCVCMHIHTINFWMAEMNLGMYIKATEPISTA